MDKQRMPAKGRKFGSSRRKQMRGAGGDVQISAASKEEPLSSEIMEMVQDVFQELDENKKGFITRADMQKVGVDLPWSAEELELIFDGLDSDSDGYLTIEEFTTGLRHFLSSQSVTREHRKRKTTSKRSSANLSVKEADNEEQKCFEAFINQLGADNIFEDKSEIWKIWVQLRQDEPHLLGDLKGFLAKMTHLIKEAKHAKETLQLMLKIRVAGHNQEVQGLYEEMEQQIKREKQRLQRESETRSQFQSMEIQEMLDVKEREIQDFLAVQKELETQFLSLREKQHMASTQNQELKQTNIALENQLQKTLHQLQETQRHLDDLKSRVSQIREEGRDRSLEDISGKTPQSPQDPLNEHETICSELEMIFGYYPSEDTLDSSPQQATDDVASITEADSESRTRVISIEEDSLEESFVEEQYFLPEALKRSSLLKELDDAIKALNKVTEPHKQQIQNLGSQGQEPSPQIKQNENSQQSIVQEAMTQFEALLRNGGPQKAISETLIGQASSQGEILLKGGTALMQANAPEIKEKTTFESRVKIKTLEPVQRGGLAPKLQSPVSSELATQVSQYKKGPIQEDSLILGQIIQPEIHNHKQVLKCRDIIRTQGLPADSEKGTVEKIPLEKKIPDQKIPDMRHLTVEEMLPAHFSARVVLPIEDESKTLFFHSSQLENMPEPEKQAQTTTATEILLSEVRRERDINMSKCTEIQEVGAEMNEETRAKSEDQVHVGDKDTCKGTTDVCLHPDHLYNVLFVGASNVGKTSFLYRLKDDSFCANMNATIGIDYCITNLIVDSKCFALRLWDTAGQERFHSVTKQFFRKADGVVLMYDVTSEHTFADVRYWLSCIQEGAGNGVTILLLGNKIDCAAERRVSLEDGACLAREYGLSFYECSAASGHNVSESMATLVRLLKAHEDESKQEVLELPLPPKKKRGCCS
ncbi:ras-related protein Rab-44 [Hemicordylus capensis]|uniref:ras-related protein Rab-44 n=1 Tax=Hemicordylus capensis TaxID=884348 RepID=UPI0023021DAF|nr:ras-related protein Rab-44 [Hemicordylus capensis]